MALPQGVNMRQTVAFVTDGANEFFNSTDFALSQTVPTYPVTTPQGNTIGWEDSGTMACRDRDSANDRRLAGVNAFIGTFRIDLPSPGDCNLRLAGGDQGASRNMTVTFNDTTTPLGSATGAPAANSFVDAQGVVYTAANWPGSNSVKAVTFTTTICRFTTSGSSVSLAHVYVEAAGGGGFTLMGQGCM